MVPPGCDASLDEWGNVDRYRAHIAGGSILNLPEEIKQALPGILDGAYQVRDYEVEIQAGSYDIYKWIDVNITGKPG